MGITDEANVTPAIRLLLLDDHPLFREGLSRLLALEPDFEVVAGCSTSKEALEGLRRHEVDLVLLDFDLGDEQGGHFIQAAREEGFRGNILMVTAGMSPTQSSLLLKQGISGIVMKHSPPESLIKAIRLAASGETWVDQKIIHQMADETLRGDRQGLPSALTAREDQVLRGVFEGLANKEIAARLSVSEASVKATLQQLFHKTGVRTRSQLVRIALERPFLPEKKA